MKKGTFVGRRYRKRCAVLLLTGLISTPQAQAGSLESRDLVEAGLVLESVIMTSLAFAYRDETLGRQMALVGGAFAGAFLGGVAVLNLRRAEPLTERQLNMWLLGGAIVGGTLGWMLASQPGDSRPIVAGSGFSIGLGVSLVLRFDPMLLFFR